MLEDLGSDFKLGVFVDPLDEVFGSDFKLGVFVEPLDEVFGSDFKLGVFVDPLDEVFGSDFTGFADFVDAELIRDPSDLTEVSPPDEIDPPYLGGSRGISRINRISDLSDIAEPILSDFTKDCVDAEPILSDFTLGSGFADFVDPLDELGDAEPILSDFTLGLGFADFVDPLDELGDAEPILSDFTKDCVDAEPILSDFTFSDFSEGAMLEAWLILSEFTGDRTPEVFGDVSGISKSRSEAGVPASVGGFTHSACRKYRESTVTSLMFASSETGGRGLVSLKRPPSTPPPWNGPKCTSSRFEGSCLTEPLSKFEGSCLTGVNPPPRS